MGRLLDIAKGVPVIDVSGADNKARRDKEAELKTSTTLTLTEELTKETNYTNKVGIVLPQCSSLALCVMSIVQSAYPIPHPAIVKAMAERGHSRVVAYAAIAYCQDPAQGWIEHNLISGYVPV